MLKQEGLERINSILSSKRFFLGVLFAFAIIFGLITFVNHYNFQTSSDPMSIYTNCLYDYRNFNINECTLLTPINAKLDTPFFDNKLSDHFNIILFLVAPFSYIFKSWTLLVFQYIMILIGGVGVYKYFQSSEKKWLPSLAMFHFFSVWGIYSALGFDYHDNVIAAMLLPWFFYFFRDLKYLKAIFIFVLMLMCKENVSLFIFFVTCSLCIFEFRNKKKLLFGLSLAIVSVSYFLIVTKVIMPSLANEGRKYLHFHYAALGNNYGEAILHILSHPFDVIRLMFVNHTNSPFGDWIKVELIYTILLSGGVFLFFKPRYLLMALPILAQKLLSDDMLKWGLNYHYCIEFVPIITFALFSWLASFKGKPKTSIRIGIVFCVLTFTITTVKNNTRKSKWFDKNKHNFLVSGHYNREDFDVSKAHELLKLIPDAEDKIVSAHYNLLPHLSLRDKIYEFPVVHDADYIAIIEKTTQTYPISESNYEKEVLKYKNSKCWKLICNQNNLLIFRRKENVVKDYTEYPWHTPQEEH